MFILLSGELAVKTQDGTQVATLSPVTTVGELGVLTNQERKATVETVGSSALLQITRTGFEKCCRPILAVQARVFRNIVEILADETVGDNVRMRDHFVSTWNTKSVRVSTAGAQNWPSPCLWMGGSIATR